MIRFVFAAVVLLVVCAPTTAAAQGPYVGASVFADVVRVSSSPGQRGETLGGTLRIGTSLTSQFGIDFEVARSGDIPVRSDARILPGLTLSVAAGGAAAVPDDVAIFPPPQIEGEARRVTLSTLLSWRHEINERCSLVYLGGVSFMRTATQHRIAFPWTDPLPIPRESVPPPHVFVTERVDYETGVAVGLDAGIEMTDHLSFVPGLRLMSGGSSWLIRPSVGLHWVF